MKYKKTIAIAVSLILSYFAAYPVGRWFVKNYIVGGWFYVGPFAGYDQGLLFSYVFFSSLFVYAVSGKVKFGIYATIPVFAFDLLTGAFNPQLWIDLILLAAGLGLAWVLLFIRTKVKT